MDNLILRSDLLKSSHELVRALIEDVPQREFISFIDNLCKDIGKGMNSFWCYFENDFSEEDEEFAQNFDYKGILFEDVLENKILLSFEDMFYYMKIASIRYYKIYPESEITLKKLLKTFAEKNNLKTI